MKNIKYIVTFILMIFLISCDVDYFDNPNEPTEVPTSSLFNNNVKRLMDSTKDTWFAGRFTFPTMQYWHQSEYGDEDRYVYRESMRNYFNNFYEIAENFRNIINLNEDEATKDLVVTSGSNANQIATNRIMLSYLFFKMTTTWGDVPYYSYGTEDEDFQALRVAGYPDAEQILTPRYAPQEKILADILKELDEAADQLNPNEKGMSGDNIYGGDVAMWIKFANSLRLRVALVVGEVNQSLASQHISDAISGGIFESNADNANFEYEMNDKNAAPMYRAWNVDKRSDFAVAHSFIELLKGENLVDNSHENIPDGAGENPFHGIRDPRLDKYAQANENGNYVGMFISESSAEAATFTEESLPGAEIIDRADFAEPLMEYAEVCFILSELNDWNNEWYEKGIKASMSNWGVSDDEISSYIDQVPDANEETVLTQKYIALYMLTHTAWTEYRRTGYPKTLIPPYAEYSIYVPSRENKWVDKVFTPLVDINHIPYRMRYPSQEQSLNKANRQEAAKKLSNGDVIFSKLWWDVD